MSTLTTLILSEQPLVAALLAMLVELAGHRPEFPRPDERLDDTLHRAPLARIALLDEQHPSAESDLFYARASRRGVAVILFGAARRRDAIARLASSRGVDWIELPISSQALGRVLSSIADGGHSAERRQPLVERTAEGDVIYRDRQGGRWFVYDRRLGSDRRRAGRGETQRLFLNEEGEMWRFCLSRADATAAADALPEALERQLARAERVHVEN